MCGQRKCLLQVLLFCCSFCQWFTKLGQIKGMRRYEDYSCWSRYLSLVNWMTNTLGRIIEKEIGFTWHLLQKCAVWNKALDCHILGAAVFLLDPWTKQSIKNQAWFRMKIGKTSSLNKRQLVSLIFKNTEWLS